MYIQLMLNKSTNTVNNSFKKVTCYLGNIGKTTVLNFKSNLHAHEYQALHYHMESYTYKSTFLQKYMK